MLLASAFLLLWFWRKDRSTLFWGLGYGCWSASSLFPTLIGSGQAVMTGVLSQSLFLSSIFLIMHGLQVRVGEARFALRWRLGIWLATVACTAWLLGQPEAKWVLFPVRLSMRLALTGFALYALYRHLDQWIDFVVFAAVSLKTVFIFGFASLVIYFAAVSEATLMTPQMRTSSEVISNVVAVAFGITLLFAFAVDLMREYRAAAMIDSLTNLANRRQFDLSLRQHWRDLAGRQQPLSMLLIDADMFKAYNDTYGHAAGDRCLVRIADAIRASLRQQGDSCARLGGEEFAVLLPNTDSSRAVSVAERLREGVQSAGLPHRVSPYGVVTVSIGVATIIPGKDVSQVLYEAADAALYRAKDGGRNRVQA